MYKLFSTQINNNNRWKIIIIVIQNKIIKAIKYVGCGI